MQRYAVKKTDTPQRIAARFYHDWTLYKIIVDANKALHDNNSFPVGSVILIPTLFTDDKEHIIELGDRYTSLSLLYYDSESYDRKIKFTNDSIILSENIGESITIPSLINVEKYNRITKIRSEALHV